MKPTFQIPLFLLLAISLVLSPMTHAASPVASAKPDSSSTPNADVVTENLKERLIETINQVSGTEPAADSLGYIGTVKDIVQNTIVLEDKNGKINILISADSDIVRSPGNTDIKLENVNIDDGIIAIGKPTDEDSELEGQRIIVSSTHFAPPKKTSGIAKVTKITSSALTLSPLGSDTPVVLDLTSKTVYKNSQGTLELDDLSIGDALIYSAMVDAKDPTDLTATIIMQIATEEPEIVPAESPKASTSASPKASPKASPTN